MVRSVAGITTLIALANIHIAASAESASFSRVEQNPSEYFSVSGSGKPGAGIAFRFPGGAKRSLFGSLAPHHEATLNLQTPGVPRQAEIDWSSSEKALARQLNAVDRRSPVFTLGYSWRNVSVENSAYDFRPSQAPHSDREGGMELKSRITRLSYQASPALQLQFSRGTVSVLDRLVDNDSTRRTTLSATTTRRFTGGEWKTAFAWGRNAREKYATTIGYLAETAVRFSGSHMMFGRLEQVGSDDLYDGSPTLRGHEGNVRRLTVGYYKDIYQRGTAYLGAGAMVRRHFLSVAQARAYRRTPISYMLFVRVKLP